MAPDSPDLLWKKIKKDHVRSFEKLYQLTYRKLGNLCYKIVDDEEAVKDILQDCYVSLYQKKDNLPDDLNVVAYLYSSVKFRAFKYLRDVLSKNKALFVSYKSDHNYEVTQQTSEDVYDEDSLVDSVLSSIAELPERCRKAFMLKYFQNMSHREISEMMDISPKTVEKHVHYGLSILKKKFQKNQILIVVILTKLIF